MAMERASLAVGMASASAKRSGQKGSGLRAGSLGGPWGPLGTHLTLPVDKWGVSLPAKAVTSGHLGPPTTVASSTLGPSGVGSTLIYRCGADPGGTYTARHAASPTPGLGSIPTPGSVDFWRFLPLEGCILRPEHVVGFDIR